VKKGGRKERSQKKDRPSVSGENGNRDRQMRKRPGLKLKWFKVLKSLHLPHKLEAKLKGPKFEQG